MVTARLRYAAIYRDTDRGGVLGYMKVSSFSKRTLRSLRYGLIDARLCEARN